MSDATEDDLRAYLEHKTGHVGEQIAMGREQYMISLHGVISGHGVAGGARSLETRLQTEIDNLFEELHSWVGSRLTEADARRVITEVARNWISRFGVAGYAYRSSPSYKALGKDKVDEILAGPMATLVERLEAHVRKFELGASGKSKDMTSAVFNVVHAEQILGGVQQAGANSTQSATVTITVEAVASAVDSVEAVLKDPELADLAEGLKGDIATLRAQLTKKEPSTNILQEAGRSVRTIVEGAAGGMVSVASYPSLAHAAGVLATVLGVA